MSTSKRAFKYSIELIIHAVDAPGTQLRTREHLSLNICLLGQHQRTRYLPATFPLHIGQTLIFEKIFRGCLDHRDVLQRLAREHVLIELLQSHVPSSILLASYETSAKDFLYPYSTDRIQYAGLRRYLILNRTVDFPGVSPSFEFTVSPSIIDITGLTKAKKTRKARKPVNSGGATPKRSKSATGKSPSSAAVHGSSATSPSRMSRSITSHTISSAVKSNFDLPETREKLRELAIEGEVKYVVPIDKTLGREPFVVRHVEEKLIGRQPQSHDVFNDGLVIHDYSLSRYGSSSSIHSAHSNRSPPRSRSPSRSRSASPTRRERSPSPSRSVDFQRRFRSPSSSTQPFSVYNGSSSLHRPGELHAVTSCDICRLHRLHLDASERARSSDQLRYGGSLGFRPPSPETYTGHASRYLLSPTLQRDSFRDRYWRSPARDLSEKIIRTSKRHIDDYSNIPHHYSYSPSRYSSVHFDDDDLLARSRRLTQS